jgi:hypothetical protein
MVLTGIGVDRATNRRESATDAKGIAIAKLSASPAPLPVLPPLVVMPGARDASQPPVPADSMPSRGAVPRVARTWTKVHARRSVRGDLVAILLPGDTVLVDSLRGSWWRVALEGRVIGYVYAGTLR